MTRQDLVDYTALAAEMFILQQGTLEQIVLSFTNLTHDEQSLVCFLLGASMAGIPYNNLKVDRHAFKPYIDETIDHLKEDGVTIRFDL